MSFRLSVFSAAPIPQLDIVLVNGSVRYALRCQRNLVLAHCGELSRMYEESLLNSTELNHFEIENVDSNDFETMISFIETERIEFDNYRHALKLLQMADRFEVPEFLIKCVRYIDKVLNAHNVIEIYKAMWELKEAYEERLPSQKVITDAPIVKKKPDKIMPNIPLIESDRRYQYTNLPLIVYYEVALLYNALQLIIMQAEVVLNRRDEITQLSYKQLETIATQDCLQLVSEKVLYHCLADWSIAECERLDLQSSDVNCRRVLKKLCHAPRYLQMSKTEFDEMTLFVDLLKPNEIDLVNERLKGNKRKGLTAEEKRLYDKFRTHRPEFPRMPIYLSDRSHPSEYPRAMRWADGRNNDYVGGWWYWLDEFYSLLCCVDSES